MIKYIWVRYWDMGYGSWQLAEHHVKFDKFEILDNSDTLWTRNELERHGYEIGPYVILPPDDWKSNNP